MCENYALLISKFVWKGIKGVGVLLPLVLIYFGNCSDMYLLARISRFAKKCPQVWDQVDLLAMPNSCWLTWAVLFGLICVITCEVNEYFCTLPNN